VNAPGSSHSRCTFVIARVAALAALSMLAACSDDSKFATLTVELARAPGAAGCASERDDLLPPEVVCLAFEMCRRSETGCEPVPLIRTDADHSAPGARVLRVARSSVVSFDTTATGGPFELTVTATDVDGAVFATATTRGITVGDAVRVRLERTETWSCAPGNTTSAPALPRALHAATLLPNGDVLLYGGVFGSDINIGARGGATLQPGIEVYDAVEQRIVPVSIGGSFAWKGRVLFASRLLPSTGAGPYTIALYGGYEANDRAVVFFDKQQIDSYHGSPIVPADGAVPGEPLRLSYDPVAHRVEIAASPVGTGSVDTGFLAATDFGSRGEAVLVLGAGAFTGADRRTMFTPRALWIDATGGVDTTMLKAARMGATVTPIDESSVLVWGGSVDEATDGAAHAVAGEIVERTDRSAIDTDAQQGGVTMGCVYPPPLAVGGELPEPTVFHTATTIGTRQIVLAGGLLVGSLECNSGVTTLYPPERPLVVISVDADGNATSATVSPSRAADYEPTIFHTATRTADGVVLLGGAAAIPAGRLESLNQAGLVASDGAGGHVFTPIAPMLAARWGHAATLLPGDRLLVTGGFETYAGSATRLARALDWSEVLPLAPRGSTRMMCTDTPFAAAIDAGVRDGAVPDGGARDGAASTDASEPDPGAVDAGI